MGSYIPVVWGATRWYRLSGELYKQLLSTGGSYVKIFANGKDVWRCGENYCSLRGLTLFGAGEAVGLALFGAGKTIV